MSADRYRLGDEIARGGMGVVYRATDTAFGREVAVKVLQDRFGPGSGPARRFGDEAWIAAQLQHPSIPPVHDLGTLPDGRPFLAMKLIKGDTLDALLAARPDPSADRGRFVAAFEQLCQAVAYAHAHGVIHRDLKPANVMVGAFGEVQVMDWGLAKVLTASREAPPGADPEATTAPTEIRSLRESDGSETQAGSVLGTPAYMAPEQAVGAVGKVDARSDVFGLGAVLAVVLTGKPPFAAASAETTRVMAAQGKVDECFERLAACGAEPDLVALCRRCLAPAPADRPADAGAVAAAVAGLRAAADERARRAELDRVRVEGEQATAAAQAAERRKRRRVLFGAAAALAAVVVGGLGAVLAVQRRANADLAGKNDELAAAAERERDKFGLALDAIAAYHTGASEDVLLREPGFEKLRAKLLADAAGFYRRLEAKLGESPDRATQAAVARGYVALGQLHDSVGSTGPALADFGRAEGLYEQLAAEAPGDAAALRELADVRLKAAKVHETRKDGEAQRRSLGRAAEAAEAALALAPDDLDAVGLLALALGQRPPPNPDLDRAVALAERVAAARPADAAAAKNLATLLNLVSSRHERAGRHADCPPIDRRVITLMETAVRASPDDPGHRLALANALMGQGVGHHHLRQWPEALAAYERAGGVIGPLAREYPSVIKYQEQLAYLHQATAITLLNLRREDEAMAALKAQADLLERLAARHTDRPALAAQHAASLSGAAKLLGDFGKSDAATDSYGRAVEILTHLTAAHPADRKYKAWLAWVLYNRGFLLLTTGRAAQAVPDAERARGLYAELARADPTDRGSRGEVVKCWGVLGQALRQAGRLPEAVAAADGSVAAAEALVAEPAATAADRNRLAWALGEAASAHQDVGDSTGAWALQERKLEIAERLAADDPKNTDVRQSLAHALNSVAKNRVTAGRVADVRVLFERALVEYERLAADYPKTVTYRIRAADVLSNLVGRTEQDGDRAAALVGQERAAAMVEPLVAADPKNTGAKGTLAYCLMNVGRLHRLLGRPAEAAPPLERAVTLGEELMAAQPDTPLMQNVYVPALRNLALLRAAEGRPGEAAALLRRALAVRTTGHPGLPALTARATAEAAFAGVAGRDPALGSLAGAAWAAAAGEGYARQAVATLREMTAHGYANYQELETNDTYDPLRERAEFQELVAAMKAKAPKPVEVAPPPQKASR